MRQAMRAVLFLMAGAAAVMVAKETSSVMTRPLRVTLLLTAAMFCIATGFLVVPVRATVTETVSVPETGTSYDTRRAVECGTVLKHAERTLPSDDYHPTNFPPCNQLIIRRAWAISSAMAGLVILFGGLVLSNDRVRKLSRSTACRIIAPFVALALPASMIPMSRLLRSGSYDGYPIPEVALLLPVGILAIVSQLLIISATRALPPPRRVPLVVGFSLLFGSLLAVGMVSNIIDGFQDR